MWTRETYKNMNNIKIFQSTTISSLRWEFISNFYLINFKLNPSHSKRAGTQWTRMMSLNAFLSSHRLQLCRKVCNPFGIFFCLALKSSQLLFLIVKSSSISIVEEFTMRMYCNYICRWLFLNSSSHATSFPMCSMANFLYTELTWMASWKQLEPLSHSSQNRLTSTK